MNLIFGARGPCSAYVLGDLNTTLKVTRFQFYALNVSLISNGALLKISTFKNARLEKSLKFKVARHESQTILRK